MKKILVPVDGSPFAEHALGVALGIAARTGAEVRLAMVAERQRLTEAVWWEVYMQGHQAYLDGILASLAPSEDPGVDVSGAMLEGDVVECLLDESTEWGADLVVICTHGHGGLSRAWLGSVADAVVHESAVPVLLVRPPEDDVSPKPRFVPSRIVVTLDGSNFAEAALSPALDLVTAAGAELALVYVVAFPAQVSSYLPDTTARNNEFIAAAEVEGRGYLEQLQGRLSPVVGPIETRVLVSTNPVRGVLEAVDEIGADLIVSASHARQGVSRWILGSVVDKIVRGGSTPVLVVPWRTDS